MTKFTITQSNPPSKNTFRELPEGHFYIDFEGSLCYKLINQVGYTAITFHRDGIFISRECDDDFVTPVRRVDITYEI